MTDNALPLEYYATVPDWTGEEAIFLLHLGIEPSEYWQSMRPAYEFIDQFTPLLKHFQRFTETFPQFPIDARYAHELTRIQATPKEWLDIYQRFPLRRELPREFIDLIVRHDDDEGETDAPEPEASDNPEKSTAQKTRRDGLTVAMEQCFADYTKRHGMAPTARALFDALADEAWEGGQIVEYDEGKDCLTWRRQDGGLSSTSFKAFQGRFPKTKSRV